MNYKNEVPPNIAKAINDMLIYYNQHQDQIDRLVYDTRAVMIHTSNLIIINFYKHGVMTAFGR